MITGTLKVFGVSPEKLSLLFLLTLRVVNGVESTTMTMISHLNIPEHQPVMTLSVCSMYSKTWWGRISHTRRYNTNNYRPSDIS